MGGANTQCAGELITEMSRSAIFFLCVCGEFFKMQELLRNLST